MMHACIALKSYVLAMQMSHNKIATVADAFKNQSLDSRLGIRSARTGRLLTEFRKSLDQLRKLQQRRNQGAAP